MANSSAARELTARYGRAHKAYGRWEDDQALELLKRLRTLRGDVLDILAQSPSEFQTARLSAIKSAVGDAIERFESGMAGQFVAADAEAYGLGSMMVMDGLEVAGVRSDKVRLLPQQEEMLLTIGADMAKGLGADAMDMVNRQLQRAVLGGISPHDAMREITKGFGIQRLAPGKIIVDGLGYRAERIVRTELHRTFEYGAWSQSAHEASLVEGGLYKWWLAATDGRTRATHRAAAQRYSEDRPIRFEEAYSVGDATLRFPGDPMGTPEETINCRCQSVAIPFGLLSETAQAYVTGGK